MPSISLNGKSCHYQDVGEGYPLLFGHSYLWTSDMWKPQLEFLSKDYRCIAPDLWSHGKSEKITQPTTIAELSENAWQLMNLLGIREFAVIGLSVGGMWGAELALRHPEAVKALVLMDTFVGDEPLSTQQKYFSMLEMIESQKKFVTPLLDQIVPLFFSPATLSQNSVIVENFRNALAALAAEDIPGIVSLGRTIFSRSCSLERLAALKQPTLILVGKDDIPRPPKEAREMADRLPNAGLQIIEDAGHISNLEQPALVNDLLSNFLKTCIQDEIASSIEDIFKMEISEI